VKERWLPVGILAGALFVVNIVARLVVRFAAGDDDDKQITIGLAALIAVGVVMIGVAYWFARRYPMPRVLADLSVATAVACVLSVFIGPFASGVDPYSGGLLVRQFLYFLGISGIGVFFGLMAVMTAGQDYKSQSWKRYAEHVKAKPRKVVRR
jgi:hypothetical protein